MDSDSSWRARSEVFQDVEETDVFGQMVRHGLALARYAVVSQEDGAIFTLDHDTEAKAPPFLPHCQGGRLW